MVNLVYPITNQLIGKDYQLLELCGEGQFSTVWKALKLKDGAIVALKILKDQGNMGILLSNEAGPLVGVTHHRITSVVRTGHTNGFYFIEMEYCSGPTLEKMISSPSPNDKYTLRDAIDWTIGVLEALDFMHSRRVSHGDVKPGNILLDLKTGNVKLTDFGNSRYMEEDIYRTETDAGTWTYQAPETIQFRERRFTSDIYSVGVVLYQLSTGRPPHLTLPELVYWSPFPRPRELNPHIPEALDGVILKALARLPQDRYNSPRTMIRHLRQSRVGLLRADSKAVKRTEEEREFLRLFLYLGEKLNYKYSDIVAKEKGPLTSRTLMEEDKRIVSFLDEKDGKFKAIPSGRDWEALSLFAHLAYRLGYHNTAISAYEKLLNEIDEGAVTQVNLQEVLHRLDRLYAQQKKLPK